MGFETFKPVIEGLIHLYGYSFLISGSVSLVLAVFQYAFKTSLYNIITRIFFNILFIPIGVFLLEIEQVDVKKSPTLLSFTICALSIGSIGLIIGMIELVFISKQDALIERLSLYCTCLVVALGGLKYFHHQK